MRKLKIIIVLTLLILSFITPFGSAFAYTGGLLNGLKMYIGYDHTTSPNDTMVLTDNNTTTSFTLTENESFSFDTAWYEFPTVQTISSYKFLAPTGNASLRLAIYNGSGGLITTLSSLSNNSQTNIAPITGVKKVVLYNISSTTQVQVYEFDVFSTYAYSNADFVSGLTEGRTFYQTSSSIGSQDIIRTSVNDNDGTTLNNIGNSTYLWAELSSPSIVNSFSFYGSTTNAVYVRLYDVNKTLIRNANISNSYSAKQVINSTSNVKYVSIYNGSGTSLTLYEIEFFGESAPVSIVKTDVTNVDVTGITKNSANVSWSNPTGYSGVTFSGAKIYVDGTLKHTASSSNTSYSLTGLTANTSYTVKVVASYSDGTDTTGITKVFNTLVPPDETAPGNVTNLVATPTFNSISLSWTNPTDQDFAKVNVYEDGIYKKSVTATEGSSAFFSNLDPETTYSFKVTSVDFTGNESSGAVIEVKTLPLPEVKKIKDLEATSKFDRVKLSWTLPESEYFHHVNIYRKVVEEESFFESLFSLGEIKVYAAEEEYKPMFETNGTYWTDLTVEPETKYEYKLTSENVDGRESTEGAVIQVETPEEPKPVLKDAEFQTETNGDYVVKWSKPTTGNIKIKVGGKDYKTVPANLKTYTIPKTDLAYTTVGDPDVTISPVTERGTEGEAVSSPKMNLPFSAKDLVESGNGLLWLVGPFILLALAFLLVPKFRGLIFAAFRGKGKLIDTNERRSTTGDKELNLEPKGENVPFTKEPKELRSPRMKVDRAEREVRIGREPRQAIREPRTPRVSRRGR
jgi:hypothetical protein